jgi:hypothetical protein
MDEGVAAGVVFLTLYLIMIVWVWVDSGRSKGGKR